MHILAVQLANVSLLLVGKMETVPNTSGLEIQANIMLHYYVDFVF